MLLTFSKAYAQLMNKEKTQTIRRNTRRWKSWLNYREERDADGEYVGSEWEIDDSKELQIYYGNPRHGGTKLGEGTVSGFSVKRVKDLTEIDAIRDGFRSRADLIASLKELYGDRKRPLTDDSEVAIISWAWVDGPHPIEIPKYWEYQFRDGDLVDIERIQKLPMSARKPVKDIEIWTTPVTRTRWSKIKRGTDKETDFGTGIMDPAGEGY